MICCTLLALLFATPAWLFARARAAPSPVAWRLITSPVERAPSRKPLSLMARLRSFGYAGDGLRFLLVHEHNARIHLFASIIAIGAGLGLGVTAADWRWILAAIAWVWAAEALNTAIEQVCNLVSPGPNEQIRAAKDTAAAAVLLSAVAAAIIGVLTFAPYLQAVSARYALCGWT